MLLESAKTIKVYHGSGLNFNNFDDTFKGSVTGAKSAKNAFWFTDNEEVAKAYAVYAAENGVINTVMAQAKKAETKAQKTKKNSDWDIYDALLGKAEELDKYDATHDRRKSANVKEFTIKGDFLEVDAENKTPQELSDEGDIDSWLYEQLREARRTGKDGVIFYNLDDAVGLYNKPSTHYAVFDKKNIVGDISVN